MPDKNKVHEDNIEVNPGGFAPKTLLEGIEGVSKPDGQELEVKITRETDEDEELQDEEVDGEEEETDDEETDEEDEDFEEDDEEVDEDEETDEDDSEESDEDDSEESDEEETDEDDSDEESEDTEDEDEEETDEDLGSDSDETSETQEFDVYDFTDGVFESKEDLKKTSELLKENPQLQQMLEFYQENGTLLPWLEATQIDVDSFSDLDILKESFRHENEDLGLTPTELDVLFEDEVLGKFNLESEDDKAKRLGEFRLKKEAAKVRKALKEQQQEFLLPAERDVEKQAKKDQEEADKQLTSAKNKLGFQIRKQIKDGKIKIQTSKDSFIEMKVSPKKLNSLVNNLQDVELFKGEDGNFDLRRMAIMSNVDAFISSITSDAEASGKNKFVKDKLKNRKPKGKRKQKTVKDKLGQKPPTSLSDLKGANIEIIQK